MKLKTTFVALIGLLVFAACNTNKGYVVTATLPDDSFNGKQIALLNFHDGTQIDTSTVVNATATFTGVRDTSTICVVRCERANAQFILENGNIQVALVVPARGQKAALGSGTPLNDAYTKLFALRDTLMEELMNFKADTEALEEEFYENTWKPKFTEALGAIFLANNNNDVGTIALQSLSNYGDKEQFQAYLDQAGDIVKNRPAIQRIIKQLEALKTTGEGALFTDFTITDEQGHSVSLSDVVGKGKYVLVDFWASWCGPCKAEMPNLKEVYKKFNGPKFTILGVAVWDKPEDTNKAIVDLEIPWPCIINAQKIPTDIYGINGIPHIILFGPDGTIIARDLRGEKIGEKVAEVLK